MTQPAPAARPRIVEHARRLAPVQVKILLGFLVLGLIGAGVYAASFAQHRVSNPQPPSVAVTPEGASGFLGARDTASPSVESTATDTTSDSWAGWGGARGATLGFGFVGGFVLGFIFRAFLKIMALITIVVGGGLAALSYYHVVNVDFTAVQHAYDSNAAWLTDQATRLKDLIVAHLPSSGGGAAGFFVGLRRR